MTFVAPTASSAQPVLSRPAPGEVHMTQYRSPLVPDALPWGNGNCGPTSALIAVRLLGRDLPGFAGERTQAAIDAARLIATGALDHDTSTTKDQQAKVFEAAGAATTRTRSLDEALAAVRDGSVALIGGDRAHPDWPWTPMEPPPADPRPVKAHASVIAGWSVATDTYLVCDPALPAPVEVTRDQLAGFTQLGADGQMLRQAILAR